MHVQIYAREKLILKIVNFDVEKILKN